MGIKSSPEIYQRAMEEIFQGQAHLNNIFDDVLLDSETLEEQGIVLRNTLETARKNDVTFRMSKCTFAQSEVEYTGHVMTGEGVRISKEKVRAIEEMPEPANREEVRTLLGLATYLSKYIPNFSDITEPLREVIKKKTEDTVGFFFEEPQREAFEKLKTALCQAPVLRFYSLTEPLTLSCDASQGGLGAVLFQGDQPIAYASKTLTDTERTYAQIEKELMAIVFGCRKFHHLLYGRDDITVETDHLPLVRIQEKPLGQVPLRLQKMLLKLQPYSFKLVGKSGKDIPVADALSRLSIDDEYPGLVDDMRDCQVCATEVLSLMAFSEEKQKELLKATSEDEDFTVLAEVITKGWPETKSEVAPEARPYWDFRDELSIYEGILFKGDRVLIPKSMRSEILQLIHASHQGIVKSKRLARDILFWSGMNKQIEDLVSKCTTCQSMRNALQKEPMLSTEVPNLPWEQVSTDLFEDEGKHYLATIDHFSGYLEIDELEKDLTSEEVIQKLKKVFATHGIPRAVYSDNGPQYDSREFKKFSKTWGFEHKTYSAVYPQANGMAEKAVQTAKKLVKKTKKEGTDLQLALLDLRNTPRDSEIGSPVQRCMGRRTRTRFPTSVGLLKPGVIDAEKVTAELVERRQQSKAYYDRHAKPLPELNMENSVRYRQNKEWVPAKLIAEADKPRSYLVQTPTGRTICRNRRHLLQTPENAAYDQARQDYLRRRLLDEIIMEEPEPEVPPPRPPELVPRSLIPSSPPLPSPIPRAVANRPVAQSPVAPETRVVTRSGRVSKAPSKFSDYVK
jgi:hypothetical protein